MAEKEITFWFKYVLKWFDSSINSDDDNNNNSSEDSENNALLSINFDKFYIV